jgi:hypothetical protein
MILKTEENRSLQTADNDREIETDDTPPVRKTGEKKGDKRKTLLVVAGFLVALAMLIVFNMK